VWRSSKLRFLLEKDFEQPYRPPAALSSGAVWKWCSVSATVTPRCVQHEAAQDRFIVANNSNKTIPAQLGVQQVSEQGSH
jgi:hypothetical protein